MFPKQLEIAETTAEIVRKVVSQVVINDFSDTHKTNLNPYSAHS